MYSTSTITIVVTMWGIHGLNDKRRRKKNPKYRRVIPLLVYISYITLQNLRWEMDLILYLELHFSKFPMLKYKKKIQN